MITLAFDTCLDKMYAVIKKDGEVLSSKIVENKDNKYHSAFLISTLQEIMSKNNIKPQDVDLIAVNIGPGSFTGIRACVTVARVMAQQLNCKAVGISSLEIVREGDQLIAVNKPGHEKGVYHTGQAAGNGIPGACHAQRDRVLGGADDHARANAGSYRRGDDKPESGLSRRGEKVLGGAGVCTALQTDDDVDHHKDDECYNDKGIQIHYDKRLLSESSFTQESGVFNFILSSFSLFRAHTPAPGLTAYSSS